MTSLRVSNIRLIEILDISTPGKKISLAKSYKMGTIPMPKGAEKELCVIGHKNFQNYGIL
jgi:hypothetical protein